MPSPKNINELRASLCDAFDWVKEDPRRVNQTREMVNASGKIISTVKVELEYAEMRKEKPDIGFLKYRE